MFQLFNYYKSQKYRQTRRTRVGHTFIGQEPLFQRNLVYTTLHCKLNARQEGYNAGYKDNATA